MVKRKERMMSFGRTSHPRSSASHSKTEIFPARYWPTISPPSAALRLAILSESLSLLKRSRDLTSLRFCKTALDVPLFAHGRGSSEDVQSGFRALAVALADGKLSCMPWGPLTTLPSLFATDSQGRTAIGRSAGQARESPHILASRELRGHHIEPSLPTSILQSRRGQTTGPTS